MEHCEGYRYMGLNWGLECDCGNEYGSVTEPYGGQQQVGGATCDATGAPGGHGCGGDPANTRCGGPWANSVYQLPQSKTDTRRWIDPDVNYDPILNALTLEELGPHSGFVETQHTFLASAPQQVRVQTVRPARFEDNTAPHLSWTLPRAAVAPASQSFHEPPLNDECIDALDIPTSDLYTEFS